MITTPVVSEIEAYLSDFDRIENASKGEPSWLRQLRRGAMDQFAASGFPTTRQEDWRFTNVTPIANISFQRSQALEIRPPKLFADEEFTRLILVNGHLRQSIGCSGIRAGSLREAVRRRDLSQYFSKTENHAFAALNQALFEDGAFIEIPNGLMLERPIHVIHVSTANESPGVSYPRTLVITGSQAQATVIESYVGAGDQVYFTNAVTQIVAGENSVVDHYKLQDERPQSFHVAVIDLKQARGSSVTTNSLSLGGTFVRNDITAVLSEGTECTLNGLYLADGRQHVDHHTTIDHASPHAGSREFYKGILSGRATGVFNGRIIVRKDAQKTDAKQTNKNLVLSEDATINTKPELQIFANDVRCTHGATVGQLDREAMFYLRSRGIAEDEARHMLTLAFARDVIDRVKPQPLREHLERLLLARLAREEQIEEAA
jgi:Fe-S cluster assembly protein SufD